MVTVHHPDHGTGTVLDVYPAGSWGRRKDGSSLPDQDYLFILWTERRSEEGDLCGFYPFDESLTFENAIELIQLCKQALQG